MPIAYFVEINQALKTIKESIKTLRMMPNSTGKLLAIERMERGLLAYKQKARRELEEYKKTLNSLQMGAYRQECMICYYEILGC